MYFYNSDKDDPQLSSEHTFDDLMNDWDSNTFLGMSHSLPSLPFGGGIKPSSDQQDQSYHWHDTMENYTLDPSVFSDTSNNAITTQDLDLILSSDSAFIRQQQIFQEQQKVKEQPHSNLSAILSVSKPPSIQPINLITSQQQSQNILNKRRPSQAEAIPIASSNKHSSIDHQRRFNELQARFRVNYMKKPKQNSSILGTSVPNPINEKPLTEKRRLSFDPAASNKPIIKIVGASNRSKNRQPAASQTANSNTNSASVTSSTFPSRTMPIQIQRQQRPNSMSSFDLEARQKKLDDQLVKTDFDDITVSELKELLRQRGKPATGKKAILLQRLQEERDMIIHARNKGISILNRNSDVASSLPDTLSSSPSGAIGSLNRSIADMHIGSPPVQQFRRFSPYGTSPRSTNTNLIPPPNNNSSLFYSSSMPAGNLDAVMFEQQLDRGFKKSYAPATSSALATPDLEKTVNPFDLLEPSDNLDEQLDSFTNQQQYTLDEQQDMTQELEMDWSDPSWEYMLRQGFDAHEQPTEELLAILGSGIATDINTDSNDLQFDISELSNLMYDNTMDVNSK